ncbi:hypothetical protein OH687_08640 [Burkholderia anthina]|nr:hypothetical protein OH687_08640 [Burkholderia anthina]
MRYAAREGRGTETLACRCRLTRAPCRIARQLVFRQREPVGRVTYPYVFNNANERRRYPFFLSRPRHAAPLTLHIPIAAAFSRAERA